MQDAIQDRPYQTEGIEFLARTPRALLAFDTRLGKSHTALSAAKRVGAKRVLIIAPAIAKVSWPIEVGKSWPDHPDSAGSPNIPYHGTGIWVLTYNHLSLDPNLARALTHCPQWDVLILDEAHYLKTPGSNRTKAIYGNGGKFPGIASNAKRVWLLTATPTPNHAGEIYPHAKALWGETASRQTFEDAFCKVQDTPWGRRITGSRNQALLRNLLTPYVLRKRKADVIADLPSVTFDMVPLDVPTILPPTVDDAGKFVMGDDPALWNQAGQPATTLRRELGVAKALPAAAWVIEQLETGINKIVVFAWHKEVLVTLYDALREHGPVMVHGGTTPKARGDAVARFQTDPACRVFIGQMIAAGTAICLDAADDVAIVEPSWTPAENYQAASRVENVGTRKAVTVSWLYAPGSLDARITEVLRTKTRQIRELWD